MKKSVILLLILLVCFGIWTVWFDTEPNVVEGTETTATAVITDRAMSDSIPYLSVEFPDGSALCLWDPQGKVIPDGLNIGDPVEVTYGKQDGFDRYILLDVKKGTA